MPRDRQHYAMTAAYHRPATADDLESPRHLSRESSSEDIVGIVPRSSAAQRVGAGCPCG